MTFRTTIVLAAFGLVGGISLAIAIGVALIVERSAREQLELELARSAAVVADAWTARRAIQAAQSRVVAEEPRLKAVVATADISHATIVGVAREINRGLGADVFLIADADGFLLADVTHPEDEGSDLRGLPMVGGALAGGEAAGVLADDEDVYRVHAQRIAFGDTVAGVLVLGSSVGDALAEELARQSGARVLFMLGDRVVARSGGEGALPDVSALASLPLGERGRELTAGHERSLAVARVLEERASGEPLRCVLVASLDRALGPSRRLTSLVAILAAIGIAVGVAISFGLSRGLSGPLDRMVAFAGRVASGDLAASASAGGLREMRALGSALDRMAAELRTSRDALAAKERMEKELEIASRLQTSLLPRSIEVPELDVAARMITASEVGGDYYDVLPRPGGGAWIAIGDVAGHGLPAGIVMLMVRTGLSALVDRDPDASPAEIVTRLNRLIHEGVKDRLRTDEHVTFCAMRHDGGGHFLHAGAHEDILVWRRSSGRCERVPTKGAWLAVSEQIDRVTVDSELALDPGDLLVLMTDGLFEATDARGEMIGLDAIIGAIEAMPGIESAAAEEVVEHVLGFARARSSDQRDDVTLLVARRRALS